MKFLGGSFNIHLDDSSSEMASNFFAHFINDLVLYTSTAIQFCGYNLDGDILVAKSDTSVAFTSGVLLFQHSFISFQLSFSSSPNATILWAYWHNLQILLVFFCSPHHPLMSVDASLSKLYTVVRHYISSLHISSTSLSNLALPYFPGKMPNLVNYFCPPTLSLHLQSKCSWSNIKTRLSGATLNS